MSNRGFILVPLVMGLVFIAYCAGVMTGNCRWEKHKLVCQGLEDHK